MNKKIEKGEFLSKAEIFAKEMSEMINANDGVKRSIVILATEHVEEENGTKQIIGVAGNGEAIAHSIAKFANQETTKPLVMQGLKLSMLESIAEKFGGGGF